MASLTVFLPNYNHGHVLPRALDSILANTVQPERIIVIDDGSTDKSPTILRPYANEHEHIDLRVLSRNWGLIPNFQQALESTTTDYFYSFAADDWIREDFFERAMGLAERHPQAGMIFGQMQVLDSVGRKVYLNEIPRWKKERYYSTRSFYDDFVNLESPMRAFGSSTIYKTTILRDLRPSRFESLGAAYDGFLGRVIGLTYGVCYMPHPVSHWTLNPTGLSQTALRDSNVLENTINEIKQWMQSDEFSPLFPESHIERWESQYLHMIQMLNNPWMKRATQYAGLVRRVPLLGRVMTEVENVFRKKYMNLKPQEKVHI